MKYMGSKDRIAKSILPIILKNRQDRDYVELFVGGFNMIDKVCGGKRIANDKNEYLIALFAALQKGWIPPRKIDRPTYNAIKNNKESYPPELVGYIGFCCSYSGKWFGGFAGEVNTKIGTVRDYQDEAFRNVMRQAPLIKDIVLFSDDYFNIPIKKGSIVYCDPPYEGTTKYMSEFDHLHFWEYVRTLSKHNDVFVSEYTAPDDFTCLWQASVRSSLSANGAVGGSKISVEKLFKYVG